jgi:Fe-S oxidoreductase
MALLDYKPMMERCSNCSFCKWIPFDKVKSARFAQNCPSFTYNRFNTYAVRGRFQMGLAIVNKEMTYTDKMGEITRDCLACGSCDVSCKVCRYNLEPLDYTIELKSDAIKAGKISPVQKKIMDSLKKEQTMIAGKRKADRGKWTDGLTVKDVFQDKVEVLFFPGCQYSYDKKLQPIARDMVKLIQKSGTDVGIMGVADACCAGRAYQMGFYDEFTTRAKNNIKAIKTAGVKLVVTPCSDCYHTLKRLYPKLGFDVEVLHIVEFLDRLISEGKLKFTKKLDMTVTYHDPCHLGRQGEPYVAWEGKEKKILNQIHTWEPRRPRYNGAHGIYEAPRNILKAIPGIELVEMERIREYSWCCGAGGGCSETSPEFSAWTAGERIKEANATGADALVTACPWCKNNFDNAKDADGNGIKVIDVVELALMALGRR